ncbi:acyl-CoA N-acyltransferase [Mycena pura]|uniref:Acyl-CoA N-acyltransferase n=1 Tax=Mycena pura TaxID=153505 RepID=A0AAD6V772_9AGAR|nr:acyl-CoA N-acyltransferase [Mycena pura]
MILDGALLSMSGHLRLAPPSPADDQFFAALRCHPETQRYIPFLPDQFTPEEARERRAVRAADETLVDFSIYTVASESESSTKYVGAIGIFHIDDSYKSCEAGISIWPESFRRGIATDAMHRLLTHVFEERRLNRVVFHTGVNNVRMRGWLERFGAILEGTLRAGNDGHGGYMDACLYSILEKDWTTTVKAKLEERIKLMSGLGDIRD